MRICPAKRWKPEKSTRINFNWHRVVLQDKVLPELEIMAKAQAIYDMGMGIPPTARIIRDELTGNEVVITSDQDFFGENGWDDFLMARAIVLKKPENLPEWVVHKSWDSKYFLDELNKHVNQISNFPENRVAYWLDFKILQSIQFRKSGPEAVLGLTHKILADMYLAEAE